MDVMSTLFGSWLVQVGVACLYVNWIDLILTQNAQDC